MKKTRRICRWFSQNKSVVSEILEHKEIDINERNEASILNEETLTHSVCVSFATILNLQSF